MIDSDDAGRPSYLTRARAGVVYVGTNMGRSVAQASVVLGALNSPEVISTPRSAAHVDSRIHR